jgi:hypothetical protein
MKVFIFLTLLGSVLVAKPVSIQPSDVSLNLYLPGLQMRFEDGADQSRSLKTGYALRISAEIDQDYFAGLSYSIQNEKSGNNSLSIERDFSEIDLSVGYKFISLNIAEKNKINFLGLGYLGQNQNKIKTELFGNVSTDTSANELSYGIGLMAQLQIKFLLIELETRTMSSRSYEPQTVSVTDVRLGFQLGL